MVILLLLASAAQVVAAAALASVAPARTLLERLLLALVILQAAVTVTVLGCGLLGVLHPAGLLVATGAWLAVCLAILWRGGRTAVRAWRPDGAAAMDVQRWPPVLLAGGLLLASAAWRAALAVRLPPLGYDEMSYHLVDVAVWLQRDGLARVAHTLWSDGYPASGDLITAWFGAFTGTSAFTGLTGLAGLPLGIVATVALARSFGVDRRMAALGGLLFALIPAVVVASSTAYVDILASVYCTAAWALGLRSLGAAAPRRRWLLVATGLAMGLAVGTKLTFALPVAILALGLLVAARRHRDILRTFVSILAPALLVGGYWYARDLVTFGNPFWPFKFGPLAGVGQVDDVIVIKPPALEGLGPLAKIVTSWTADFGATAYAYDTRVGGFGVIWLPLLAVAVIGAATLVRRRRWTPLALVVAPAVVTLAVMPMQWWPRYTLFLVPVAMCLAGVALARVRPRGQTVIALLLVAATTWSLGVATAGRNFVGKGLDGWAQTGRTVLSGRDVRRDSGMWAECRAFREIPSGSSITFRETNYGLLAIGPDFDRILLDPPTGDDAPALAASVRHLGADYLVARDRTADLARAVPGTFEDLGEACRGISVFRVLPAP